MPDAEAMWEVLTEEAEVRFADQELRLRGGKMSFRDFIRLVAPRFLFARHHEVLIRVLQEVADGKRRRVMIFMPRRHGKSEVASRLFPAYMLYLYPERWVALASYSAELAYMLSKNARNNLTAAGVELDPSASAVKLFQPLRGGGGMWATGVGGSSTGRGWHVGIIDDAVKDGRTAMSELEQAKLRDWYASAFYNGQQPPDALVIINTRWAPDDLTGFLLAQEEIEAASEDGEPERWHIVSLPAMAYEEGTAPEYPATCTVEPDWRQPGEALWPERYPIARLLRIKRNAKAWWEPMYQQRPQDPEGSIFKRAWFTVVPPSQVPVLLVRAMGVDLAVTEATSADWTVGTPGALGANGKYYIFRPYREQVEAPDAEDGIARRAHETRSLTIGVEKVAYQAAFGQHMRRRVDMAGRAIVDVQLPGDKVLKAHGWSPIAAEGLIILVEDPANPWTSGWLDRVTGFPKGKTKDEVDSVGVLFDTFRQAGAAHQTILVGGERDNPLTTRT